jgi:hypothetical protein
MVRTAGAAQFASSGEVVGKRLAHGLETTSDGSLDDGGRHLFPFQSTRRSSHPEDHSAELVLLDIDI